MSVGTASGPVVLTYSGEAYNFAELRDGLRRRATTFAPRAIPRWSCVATWNGRRCCRRLQRHVRLRRLGRAGREAGTCAGPDGHQPLYIHPTTTECFSLRAQSILANPLVEPTVGLDGCES